MKNMQISGAVTIQGTEHIKVLGTGTNDVPPTFKVLYSAVMNPAEPGLAPMLAATANQFQRFQTSALRFTYSPTASTATDGTLYFCVFPDPETPDPTSVQEMSATGNMQSYPAYGASVSWAVPAASIQQSYKIQTTAVPELVGAESTMNVSGKIVVAEVGVPINKTIGNLLWTYAYKLSLAKITQGANSLHGHYRIPPCTLR